MKKTPAPNQNKPKLGLQVQTIRKLTELSPHDLEKVAGGEPPCSRSTQIACG